MQMGFYHRILLKLNLPRRRRRLRFETIIQGPLLLGSIQRPSREGSRLSGKFLNHPMAKRFQLYAHFPIPFDPNIPILRRFNLALIVQVFEVIKKQEETKQTELAAKVAEFRQMKAQHETVSSFDPLCFYAMTNIEFYSLGCPSCLFCLGLSIFEYYNVS